MVWPKVFLTDDGKTNGSDNIGSVTLKEGRALEGALLLFSSTTLGTCTSYGYVERNLKVKFIIGAGLKWGGYRRDGVTEGRH